MSCTGLPSISNVPLDVLSKPPIRFSVVVLPQPLGPSSAKNSPLPIVRSMFSSAVVVPKRLVTPRSSTAGRSPMRAAAGDAAARGPASWEAAARRHGAATGFGLPPGPRSSTHAPISSSTNEPPSSTLASALTRGAMPSFSRLQMYIVSVPFWPETK